MSLFRRKKKATSKPSTSQPPSSPSSPSPRIEVMSDHDGEGDVSTRSSPQPAEELYDLIEDEKWDEASSRCRTHPQDARYNYYGKLPIHRACQRTAPLSLIRQIHEAYGEGVKATDKYGWLPLHLACFHGALLEVITYLVEAYGKGVRTTTNYSSLPLHIACYEGASLETITYLHGLYPDGATKKDKNGNTPADWLKDNKKLSEEDKAKARDILSTPHPVRTSPPRPQPMDHTPVQKAATTTPVDVPNTTTTSATTSTVTSKSTLHSVGAVNTTVDHGGEKVAHGGAFGDGRGGLVGATYAAEAALAAHARARAEASRLAEEASQAEDGSRRADEAVAEKGAVAEEAEAAAREAEEAARVAREASDEAKRRHDAAVEEAEAARVLSRRKRDEAEEARANVRRTFDAAKEALRRKREVRSSAFSEDREKLRPFFESTGGHGSTPAKELSLEYVRDCTSDENGLGEGDFTVQNVGFSDERKLGEGAFGVVYSGYDDLLQRRFAVKRIKYEMRTATNDEDVRATRKMLENELKVLNEFQHTHIARLYGYVLTEDLKDEQVLVYELASRGSLSSFFESEAKRSELPWQRRVLIALQVSSALRFLHEGGGGGGGGVDEHYCYHRDIKSSNICLRADYSAVLIDCGLAKMIPKKNSRAHGWTATTRSGGQPGTIEYMCPLYATGFPVSDRTDVFAFGMVLLELFTGRLQQSRPDGFFDRYVSMEGGGPGDASLVGGDIDQAAGTWKSDARNDYSGLALECIQTRPNNRPTMREVFRRLGDIAQTHCYLEPEEVEDILGGRQASSYERVLDIVEEVRAMQEEAMAKQDKTIAKQVESIARQEEANMKLSSIAESTRETNVKIDTVLQRMQWMTAALTSVVREESCKCPRLAIMVPSGAYDRISLRSPSTWVSKDVHLYFLCACDLTPVQNPVVFSVTRDWLKKAMPFLKIGMFVLRAASVAGRASTGLPFDILPGLAGEGLNHLDTGYLSILGSQWTVELESYCESLVSAGGSGCTEAAVMSGKALTDEAYEVVAEKACEENNKSWSREMELVESGRDGLVWIKRENKTRWIQRIEKS